MKSSIIKLLFCVLALVVFSVNCFGQKNEPAPDPRIAAIEQFTRFSAIDQIIFLPIVDARSDKRIHLDFDSMRGAITEKLKGKHYTVIMMTMNDSKGNPIEIAEEDLNKAKPDWIKQLGPKEARYIMVLGIGELRGKNFAFLSNNTGSGLGSTGIANVFGFIFDKQDGSILWKKTNSQIVAVGAAGLGGVLEAGGKVEMELSALDAAFSEMLTSIPKTPKKHK